MPTLYRISNHCDLGGVGGEKTDGRWHTAAAGRRIVYLSEHPAVALLESLANLHSNPALLPDKFRLLKVNYPDTLRPQPLQPPLPEDWRVHQSATRATGNDWLAGLTGVLLMVPSVPSPESFNYLMNPLHPDAGKVKIEWCKWFGYDRRLFRLGHPPPNPPALSSDLK
jgi:RES domain-containing protein